MARRVRQAISANAYFTTSFRAGDRTRTGDVQLGKLAFYQLNYTRNTTPEILAVAEWGVNWPKSRRYYRAPARRLTARSRRAFREEA